MKPLRILLVMIEPPLPFGNAPSRWFYVLLNGLVERGHRVTAFASCSKPEQIEQARQIFPAARFDLRCFPNPARKDWRAKWDTIRQPHSYMFGPDLREALRSTAEEEFDILHLEQSWSGWLGSDYVDRALVNVHHLVSIDLEYDRGATTWRERLGYLRMFRAEKRVLRPFKFIRACSPRLVEPIRQINPGAEITTVPVGVDPSQYDFPREERSRQGPPTIGLIGSMGWYPSYSAAVRLITRLWPEIKRRLPDAQLRIAGWSARSALHDYLELPGVQIEENVPSSRGFFQQLSVFLYAPSRGSGMKIKTLEAMAYGIPVVTTSEGIEGLPAEDGVHAGICEDDAGLVERVVKVLSDPSIRDRQRTVARKLIEDHCGPRPTVDAIERIYARMIQVRG